VAKLPGILDLGATPTADPTRPVGTYDVTPYARGAQAIAEGGQQLGKGMEGLGKGATDFLLDKNRWDFAKAHADLLSRKFGLDDTTAQSTDYGPDADSGRTMPQRYADDLKWAQGQSAALISDPRMRERFVQQTAPMIAEATAKIDGHARALEGNANVAFVQAQGDNLQNKGLATDDDAARGQVISAYGGLVDGLQGKGWVTPEQAFGMKRQWGQQFATGDYLSAVNSGNPDRIESAIHRLRAPPGSDGQLVERFIQAESGGDPHARAKTSSAYGAAQFLASRPGGDETWAQLLGKYHPELAAGKSLDEVNALRGNPQLAREMLGHLIEQNRGILQKNGVEATPGALYLSHFLGPAGAVAVAKAGPNAPVGAVLAKAVGPDMAAKMVAANPGVLAGKTAGDVGSWASRKVGGGDIYDVLHVSPELRERLIGDGLSALARARQEDAGAVALEQHAMRGRLNDDLASMLATGQGLDKDIDPAQAARALGPKAVAEWQAAREDSRSVWTATHDMATLPAEAIAARLGELAPKPGEENFERRQRVYDAAAKTAQGIQQQREEDPAGSVENDPVVRKTRAGFAAAKPGSAPGSFDQNDPKAWAEIGAARFAAQERAGIPAEDRSPITKAEALQFTVPLQRMLPGEESDTVRKLGQKFQQMFGKDADSAFAYALRVHKVDAKAADTVGYVIRKLIMGEPISLDKVRAGDQQTEIAAADAAVTNAPPRPSAMGSPAMGMIGGVAGMMGRGSGREAQSMDGPPAKPEAKVKSGQVLPPADDIVALRGNPALAQRFDAKYGVGAAKKILDAYPVGTGR
jgi:hypothetical protein